MIDRIELFLVSHPWWSLLFIIVGLVVIDGVLKTIGVVIKGWPNDESRRG